MNIAHPIVAWPLDWTGGGSVCRVTLPCRLVSGCSYRVSFDDFLPIGVRRGRICVGVEGSMMAPKSVRILNPIEPGSVDREAATHLPIAQRSWTAEQYAIPARFEWHSSVRVFGFDSGSAGRLPCFLADQP